MTRATLVLSPEDCAAYATLRDIRIIRVTNFANARRFDGLLKRGVAEIVRSYPNRWYDIALKDQHVVPRPIGPAP
jgi:hypothetical protein